MKRFMYLLAALAALTLSSVSCNKDQLEDSLIGTRWTYNSLISSMSIFFLKDGYCSTYLTLGQEKTVGNKGSYSIEYENGEAWIIVDTNLEVVDLASMRGKYEKGANKIEFEKNGDPNDTITLLLD